MLLTGIGINPTTQQAFIATRLPARNGNFYIGLEGTDKDDEYKWIDGMDPEYTNWDYPLYTDPPPYCAVMRSGSSSIHGRWNRRTCTSNRQHICQIPIDDDHRWQEFGESQYLIKFTPHATPSAARETCQSYGGDLAIIKTAEVNTFLKALLPTCSDSYFCYLIGFRRSGKGTFYWLDDTAIQYKDWYSAREPNDADSWGCLGTRDGASWYDQTSQLSSPYICERTPGMNSDDPT
ncbi:macrophage mannose receptor 1-like [Strongylocentrotus purpuratus]|uniref:C-type lectin domain-containing protein n=1 Tax=Strongylocentrotus purpuratus TaxID=7668 RepID=A0A7M7T466_STRPU|nr:macrophage mannose receptor 1-like [Strongylocentrotus purpuratus]